MSKVLSIDSLIVVSTTITKSAGQSQSTSALLALTPSTVIDLQERMRGYANLSAVASDFGTSGPEYAIAQLWFGQSPQPNKLFFGTWAQASRAGRLVGATLSVAQQAIGNFNTIANGGFKVAIDAVPSAEYKTIALTAASNLNAVAAAINAQLGSAAQIVWNAAYSRFEMTSSTAGAASQVGFLTAPTTGSVTDLGPLLGMTSANAPAAYSVLGAVAETPLAAATLFEANFGQQFYGLTFSALPDADHIAVAGFIESTKTKHTYWVTTSAAATLLSTSTTDLAYLLKAAGYTRTFIQYSSTSAYAAVSAAALLLTVDYTGSNTVITLMYQEEPGVTPESINQSQTDNILAKNCNVYSAMDDGTNNLQAGTMASGDFADNITGADSMAITMSARIYTRLKAGRVAQTNAGMHDLLTETEQVGAQYVTNGFLAPGQWNGPLFGALAKTNDGQNPYLSKGYYDYAAPVETQAQADRDKRIAVPIQFAAKLAGAVHKANVMITINP